MKIFITLLKQLILKISCVFYEHNRKMFDLFIYFFFFLNENIHYFAKTQNKFNLVVVVKFLNEWIKAFSKFNF